MKRTRTILLGTFLLIALQFGWTGCVGVGVVGDGDGYRGGVWFHDDIWLDGGGRGWYGGHGGGGYVHPRGFGRPRR